MSRPSTTYAPELGERLRELLHERAAAASSGLGGNRAYMDDLEHEVLSSDELEKILGAARV